MTTEEIIAVLKSAEAELRARGVDHVALFGWVAKELTTESNIDIVIEIPASSGIGYFRYIEIVSSVKSLFSTPIEVADMRMLKYDLKPLVESLAVYAF